MKSGNFFIVLSATVLLLASCKEDNFEPPKSTLTGRVVYQNTPVGLRSNGVQLELWQRGFQLFSKIPVHLAQDGTFSASLYDGDYKLVRLRGNGPWVDNTDTIEVQVRGSAAIDVPVQPYYTITNEAFQKSGTALAATCKVNAISSSRAIERVTVYVGTTQYVDVNNNVGSISVPTTALADLTKELTVNYPLPSAVSTRAYFYARIGVKTSGVAELLYTPVQKIQ